MLLFFLLFCFFFYVFFFSSRRRHTRFDCDWSSDVCSSDLCRAADGTTVLAVVDPTDQATLRAAQIVLGAGIDVKVASSEDVVIALNNASAEEAERSEERRVGKECRARAWAWEESKNVWIAG